MDETLYLKQLAFSLTSVNLIDNFSDVSSWKLESEICPESLGLESAQFSSGILVLSLNGTGCKTSSSIPSESIAIEDQNVFTLKFKPSVSDTTKKASITTKVMDTVDNASAIWQWSDVDLWNDVTRGHETIYTTVNGSATATTDLTTKK